MNASRPLPFSAAAPGRAYHLNTVPPARPTGNEFARVAFGRRVTLAAAGLFLAAAMSGFWLLYIPLSFPVAAVAPRVDVQALSVNPDVGSMIVRSRKGDLLVRRATEAAGPVGPGVHAPSAGDSVVEAIDERNSSTTILVRQRSATPSSHNGAWNDPGLGSTTPGALVRVAALPGLVRPPAAGSRNAPHEMIPRVPMIAGPRTTLVEFATAPFPYDGNMPGSNRPFLNTGEAGNRGHTNFRGRVLRESETFSDNRVLLHIPPRFNPNRPGVMVVFFHGHGATLERDVRDRQQVPAQISASGVNAVLVAPQFAVDAADSSAGKFWEPGGFKRFVDEAAVQLARLYGDPRATRAFANMPIVIVAYSGGFGPTLAVLDHGGVNSRLRGLVLLDALYSGTQRFASWIASNKSAFFVSSYTPHTHGMNAELERLLSERSVAYGGELRSHHLPGSVTFLPTGAISHRDFVNRAWTDSPLKDILVRLDDYDLGDMAATTASTPSAVTPSGSSRRDD